VLGAAEKGQAGSEISPRPRPSWPQPRKRTFAETSLEPRKTLYWHGVRAESRIGYSNKVPVELIRQRRRGGENKTGWADAKWPGLESSNTRPGTLELGCACGFFPSCHNESVFGNGEGKPSRASKSEPSGAGDGGRRVAEAKSQAKNSARPSKPAAAEAMRWARKKGPTPRSCGSRRRPKRVAAWRRLRERAERSDGSIRYGRKSDSGHWRLLPRGVTGMRCLKTNPARAQGWAAPTRPKRI